MVYQGFYSFSSNSFDTEELAGRKQRRMERVDRRKSRYYTAPVVLSSRFVEPIDERGRNGPFIVRGYRSPSTLAIKMIGPAIIKSPRQLVPVHDAFLPMNQSESRFNRTGTFWNVSPIPFARFFHWKIFRTFNFSRILDPRFENREF